MKVIVRCYWLEIGLIFAAGYFVGTKCAENKASKDDTVQVDQKKKKSVRYQDGELIFTIFK